MTTPLAPLPLLWGSEDNTCTADGPARALIGRYQRPSNTPISLCRIKQHSDNYYSRISRAAVRFLIDSYSTITDICKEEMLKEICRQTCRLIKVHFCPKNPDVRKSVALFSEVSLFFPLVLFVIRAAWRLSVSGVILTRETQNTEGNTTFLLLLCAYQVS
jgi:hypothetical protein